MDPNAALREIRELVRDPAYEHVLVDHKRLCELVQGLDDWLTTGGFLPKDWRR